MKQRRYLLSWFLIGLLLSSASLALPGAMGTALNSELTKAPDPADSTQKVPDLTIQKAPGKTNVARQDSTSHPKETSVATLPGNNICQKIQR